MSGSQKYSHRYLFKLQNHISHSRSEIKNQNIIGIFFSFGSDDDEVDANCDAEKSSIIGQFYNLEHPVLLYAASPTVQKSLSIRLKCPIHTYNTCINISV